MSSAESCKGQETPATSQEASAPAPRSKKAKGDSAPKVTPDEAMPDIARTTCKVSSSPDGAEIWVNGKATGQVTPADINLWAGKVSKVEVKKKGYFPANVTIAPNLNQNTEKEFILKPSVAFHVESTPPGAAVSVDGEHRGNTPETIEVTLGSHTVVLSLAGHVDFQAVIDAGVKPVELSARLLDSTFVRVETFPGGATLFLDGVELKDAGSKLAVSANQKHYLTAAREGYSAATEVVGPFAEGETNRVTVTLETGKPERLRTCARKAQDRLKVLERTVKKTTADLAHAGLADGIDLKDQLAIAAREQGARQVEVEHCNGAAHAR